jgi:hypothetical protein
VGRAPEADSSVEAAVALGEAAGAAVASGPPDMLPALASAAAEAVVVLVVECNAPNFAVEFFFFSLLAKIRALPFPFLFPFAKP